MVPSDAEEVLDVEVFGGEADSDIGDGVEFDGEIDCGAVGVAESPSEVEVRVDAGDPFVPIASSESEAVSLNCESGDGCGDGGPRFEEIEAVDGLGVVISVGEAGFGAEKIDLESGAVASVFAAENSLSLVVSEFKGPVGFAGADELEVVVGDGAC